MKLSVRLRPEFCIRRQGFLQLFPICFIGLLVASAQPAKLDFETVFTVPPGPAVFEFHEARREFYRLDAETGTVVAHALEDGAIRARYTPAGVPSSLSLAQGGRWLYVTHFDERQGRPYLGTNVTEIDLENPGAQREVPMPGGVLRVVVRADRVGVVLHEGPQGVGQPTVQLVNFASGVFGGSGAVIPPALLLAPEGTSIFAMSFNNDLGGHDRVPFDAATLTFGRRRSLPITASPVTAFLPDGKALIAWGEVFSNTPDTISTDLKRIAQIRGEVVTSALFDPARTNFFLGNGNRISIYRRDRWEAVQTYPAEPLFGWVRLGDTIYGARPDSGTGGFAVFRFANPLVGMETNTPPIARFRTDGAPITTAKATVLDASESTDSETPVSQLSFRWDLDGNGVFDTAPSTNATVSIRPRQPGSFRVGVQVQDAAGEVVSVWQDLTATQESVPATPILGASPWALGFTPSTTAFDTRGGWLYAVDQDGKRLVRVSLEDGIADRYWPLQDTPGPMAIQPDGKRLYLGEARPSLNPNILVPIGSVVEFDLERGVRDREMALPRAASNLAALDGGVVVVVNDTLRSYQFPNPAHVSTWPLGDGTDYRVSLHPSGKYLYLSNPSTSVESLRRYQINWVTGELDPPYLRERPYIHVALVNNGSNFVASSLQYVQATPHLPTDFAAVNGVTFAPEILNVVDLPSAGLFGIRHSASWDFHRGDGTAILRQAATLGTAQVAANERWLYEVVATRLERRRVPTGDPVLNLKPVAEWENGQDRVVQVGQTIPLRVWASDEDGAITRFEFTIDGAPIFNEVFVDAPAPPRPGTDRTRYAYDWRVGEPGSFVVGARLVDNLGAVTELPKFRVRVNRPPELSVEPLPSGPWPSPFSFVLHVNATDLDGTVSGVEANYLDAAGRRVRQLGRISRPPYEFPINGLSGWLGSIQVRVVDNEGAISVSTLPAPLAPTRGDDFLTPWVIEGTNGTWRALASLASTQVDDRILGAGPENCRNTLWWEWVAPTDLAVTLDTFESDHDTALQVNRVRPDGSHARLASNDDEPLHPPQSRVKFEARSGERFAFMAWAPTDVPLGEVVLRLTSSDLALPVGNPPANDNVAQATPLIPGPEGIRGTTVRATFERREVEANPPWTNTVWYTWTAPEKGFAEVTAESTEMDPRVLVFIARGAPFSDAFRWVADNDDVSLSDRSSRCFFAVEAGTPYAIRVNGVAPRQGAFTLRLRFPVDTTAGVPPANDRLDDATVIETDHATFTGHTYLATAESAETFELPNERPTDVWFRWTAPNRSTARWTAWNRSSVANPSVVLHRRNAAGKLVGVPLTLGPNPNNRGLSTGYLSAEAGVTYYAQLSTPGTGTAMFYELEFDNRPLEPLVGVALQHRTDGTSALRITTRGARKVSLESTTDFEHWQPAGSFEVTEAGFEMPVPVTDGTVPTFFRAALYE